MSESALTPELAAIADFIHQIMPFNALPEDELSEVVHRMEIGYFRNGHVFDHQTREQGLRILRNGAVELRNEEDELLDRLAEGESFALNGLLKEDPGIRAVLIEDSLIYFLPQSEYEALRGRHRDFDRFFHGQRSRRLSRATRSMISPDNMLRPIRSMMTTELITTDAQTRVQDLAALMSRERVSSVLVIENDQLTGIVTDRDLRNRVLAEGRNGDTQVADVMTRDPVTLSEKGTLFDATLLMTRHGLHHLPVVKERRAVGILTTADLISARQDDPVYIVQRVSRQESVDALQSILQDVPRFLVHWTDAGVPADQVSHILTAISDAVTCRIIDLAVRELGPAPVSFCWICFGSQARSEQLLNADQDNGLIISNEVTKQQMEWFVKLARFVSDGLDACGYVYCSGNVMATNPAWRKTVTQWQEAVNRWTSNFSPIHVMEVSIAFDIRGVYGDTSLVDQVQAHMLESVRRSSIFQAALAENVLHDTAPIGIFRRFVVERNGEHKDTLNLKKRGILPIVEIVRLHALAAGIAPVNTLDRLHALAAESHMTRYDSRNLQDALRFLMQVRLQIQARQIREEQPLSNYCNPHSLPTLAKEQLRDAFRMVDNAQKAIRLSYRQGMR